MSERAKFRMTNIHPAHGLSEVAGIVAAKDVPNEKKVTLIRDYIDVWVERNCPKEAKMIFCLGGMVAMKIVEDNHKEGVETKFED